MIVIPFYFTVRQYCEIMSSDSAEAEPEMRGPLAPLGCYRIIYDESQVRQFYRRHVAQFEQETYYSFLLFLCCRRKYFPELTTTDVSFPRKTFSTFQKDGAKKREDLFVQELRLYEVAEGLYTDKRNDAPIPTNGLAMYMTCDPLKEFPAWFKTQSEMNQRQQTMMERLMSDDPGKAKQEPLRMNVESVFKDRLHASPSRIFKKLDVDTKDPEKIAKLRQMFKENGITPSLVIESNGGFHVVLNTQNGGISGEAHRALHEFGAANKDWMTVEKNALVIIPGTLQGGFPTKIVKWD